MSEKFPTIPYGPGYGPRAEWENQVLLAVLQSSIGLIGPQVRGIAVEARADRIVIHTCLGERTERALEDVDDLVGDLEANLAGAEPEPTVVLQTEVGEMDRNWSGHGHRRLYGQYIYSRDSEPGPE